jgi:hypothetical protein
MSSDWHVKPVRNFLFYGILFDVSYKAHYWSIHSGPKKTVQILYAHWRRRLQLVANKNRGHIELYL